MTPANGTDQTDDEEANLLHELKQFEGQAVGPPWDAPDPVNQPMIRHWVEAMGDENPVYVDEGAARANGFSGVIAPPTMLQAWVMRGYRATAALEAARSGRVSQGRGPNGVRQPPQAAVHQASAQERLYAMLDGAGFTSVVATNCEQEYRRPLVLGDVLSASSVIESVSAQKSTGLGDGHFVTTRTDLSDQNGELVATMRFRILRFRPRSAQSSDKVPASSEAAGAKKSEEGEPAPARRRPRPPLTRDNAFFFEGARQGRLLIQRCAACGRLRHPPRPACAHCRSFEWDSVQASGRGTVYSYVVVHHPQVPGFDYPLPIAVVELEEGTRLVADLVGVAAQDVEVGMPVACELVAVDEELTLPMFRPTARTGAG